MRRPLQSEYTLAPVKRAGEAARIISNSLRFGLGIYRHNQPSGSEANFTGVESIQKSSFCNILRLKDDLVYSSILTSIGGSDQIWPVGGVLDMFMLQVFDTEDKTLRFAVDAVFVKPFGDESEETSKQQDADLLGGSESNLFDFENARLREASMTPTPDALQREGNAGLRGTRFDLRIPKNLKFETSKDPIIATDFLKERRFLKAWHSIEDLSKELREGFVATKAVLSDAGTRPMFVPLIEVDCPSLCMTTARDGPGNATIEILPKGALRPQWWLDLMGNSCDMPRPCYLYPMKWAGVKVKGFGR